jgi:pantoate--beta-alanine ligase
MQRVTSISALNAELDAARERGLEIAFVPTMGALHEGHLSLINEARRHAPFVVVSIFVNPLQFGAGEDFEKYPRTIEDDAAKLEEIGVSVLFTPTVNDLYKGNMNVSESAGKIGELYEGAARPDHFDGMLTVVAKLFEAVRPKYAVFGAKDAQQVFLVKQMAAQEFPELEIVVAPTVREANGLALSSRNRYLSEADHKVAQQISAALQSAQQSATSPSSALAAARNTMLSTPEAKLDYIALVDADTFEAVTDGFTGRAILLIAAVVGETRLIDNIEITF